MVMSHAAGVLPGVESVLDDFIHPHAMLHLGKNKRSGPAHSYRIPFHHPEVRAHGLGQIGFVDHQQIGLRDAGPAFAGDFVTARDVNDLDGEVRQLPAETRREIVAPGFDEQKLRMEGAVQFLQRQEVRRNVFADRRVRTAAGLDGADAFGGQRVVLGEKFAVLLGEDIIGHGGNVQLRPQLQAELQHEGGLATADRPAHAHGEGAPAKIAIQRRVPVVEMSGMIQVIVGVPVALVRTGMEQNIHQGWFG